MARQKKIDLEHMTEKEKMKYEIAGELGLLERVLNDGWRSLTAKETGRIGGLVTRRKRQMAAEGKNENEEKISGTAIFAISSTVLTIDFSCESVIIKNKEWVVPRQSPCLHETRRLPRYPETRRACFGSFGEVREKFMEAKKEKKYMSDIHLEDYTEQYETGFATVDTMIFEGGKKRGAAERRLALCSRSVRYLSAPEMVQREIPRRKRLHCANRLFL